MDLGQVALLTLLAGLSSCVIFILILIERRDRRFAYAALAGIIIGFAIDWSPVARKLLAFAAEQDVPWFGRPILGLIFALLVAAAGDALLSSKLPVFKYLRLYGRHNLTSSTWFSALEIAERSGVKKDVVEKLKVAAAERPAGLMEVARRLRVAATALCGSCIFLFILLEPFRDALVENLSWDHLLVNLIGTIFVIFFFTPLHHVVTRLVENHAPQTAEPASALERDYAKANTLIQVGKFAAVFVILYVLQVVHASGHEAFKKVSAAQWVVLIELCLLPMIVTAYYLVAASRRGDLGERRWDRAFCACAWAGSIVLLPFVLVAVIYVFEAGRILPAFEFVSIQAAVIVLGSAILLIAVTLFFSLIFSVLTYGLFAIALGLALDGAKQAQVWRRVMVAVPIAGVVLQLVIALFAWPGWLSAFKDVKDPLAFYFGPIFLVVGWTLGLAVSGFQENFEPSKTPVANST